MVNVQLRKLYLQHFDTAKAHINFGTDAAFPFMLKVDDRYEKAKSRIEICGQETDSWNGEEYGDVAGSTVDSVMERYNIFVNKEHGYNSPYWILIRALVKDNPDIGFVTNNVVKIGKPFEAGCDNNINELALKYFPVFRKEQDILKPDLIIFLTGPNYDWRIEQELSSFKKKNCLDVPEIAALGIPNNVYLDILTFDDSSLPKAIRINHPGWYRRIGFDASIMVKALNIITKRIL